MISNTDHELSFTRLEVHTRLLHDVQSALARIGKSTYGFCEECEEPIGAGRLDAVPWAQLCIRCQERAEAMAQADETKF